jgi:hypothetical protein
METDMTKITIGSAMALLLCGCIFTSQFPLPDGSNGYQLTNCKDTAWCARKAAKICGGRYEVISEGERQYVTGNSSTVIAVPQHEMIFRCPD